jgi:hypothetical protein
MFFNIALRWDEDRPSCLPRRRCRMIR